MNATAMQSSSAPLLTTREVLGRLKVSRTCLDNMVRHGEFPQPVRAGKLLRWPPETVEQWIQQGGAKQ